MSMAWMDARPIAGTAQLFGMWVDDGGDDAAVAVPMLSRYRQAVGTVGATPRFADRDRRRRLLLRVDRARLARFARVALADIEMRQPALTRRPDRGRRGR
jgi:hypothetical protein